MIDDRRLQPAATGPENEAELGSAASETWTPSAITEERRWRDQLHDEIRPLVDSLARLRERGLLD